MHLEFSALLKVMPTLASCYTDLECDHAYVGLHVFACGSRLHHPNVQFAASGTKPLSDKIEDGSEI